MQAIHTRVIPATDTKPTRYKVSTARGSIIIGADAIAKDDVINSDSAHRRAALQLVWKFLAEDSKEDGTPQNENPWARRFSTGCLPDGTFAHVFTE